MFLCVDKKVSRLIFAAVAIAMLGAIAMVIPRQDRAVAVQTYEWGLHFEKDNTMPVPNLSDQQLNPYNAYFHGNTGQKIIYITFNTFRNC